MREPPEPLDYVSVPCCVGGYVGRPRLVGKPSEKVDGAALVLPVLAVHERHVQEHPLEGRSSLSSACSTAYLEDSSAAVSAAWVRPSPRNMLRGTGRAR